MPLQAHNARIDAMEPTDRLLQLARETMSSAWTQIVNRRDHPSYGYSKASIRASIDRAEGMLRAWAIIAGHAPHLASGLPGDIAEVQTLAELREALKTAR